MSNLNALTCKELVDLVTAYFESALSDEEHIRFEAHAKTCGDCDHYLEQMRYTITLIGKLSEETIPVRSRDVLLEAFRDWRKQNS